MATLEDGKQRIPVKKMSSAGKTHGQNWMEISGLWAPCTVRWHKWSRSIKLFQYV